MIYNLFESFSNLIVKTDSQYLNKIMLGNTNVNDSGFSSDIKRLKEQIFYEVKKYSMKN